MSESSRLYTGPDPSGGSRYQAHEERGSPSAPRPDWSELGGSVTARSLSHADGDTQDGTEGHKGGEHYERRQWSSLLRGLDRLGTPFRARLESTVVTHSHQSHNTKPTAAPTRATARISLAMAITRARPLRSLFFFADASILSLVSATISEATASLSSHRSLTA